ncbi:molybdenum cofactor biosynthesis protein MoaB [soil metagenome]
MSESLSVKEHREAAPVSIRVAVLTLSDTRNKETDKSGAFIRQALDWAGHEVVAYEIRPDDPGQITELIHTWASRDDLDAILTNGGTGIARRDSTYDAIAALLEKQLVGFGELFRMLSYEQIGAAAMLSRATAGTIGDKIVVAMPGSSNAVQLAMEKLILPEIRHLVFELRK